MRARASPTPRPHPQNQISTLYAGEGKTSNHRRRPGRETEIRDMEVATGSSAKRTTKVVVDADLAKAMQIKVGDTLRDC